MFRIFNSKQKGASSCHFRKSNLTHQMIIGTCEVIPAPFAVNLDANNANWTEPDISVICDKSKLDNRGCNGAPSLYTFDLLVKSGIFPDLEITIAALLKEI